MSRKPVVKTGTFNPHPESEKGIDSQLRTTKKDRSDQEGTSDSPADGLPFEVIVRVEVLVGGFGACGVAHDELDRLAMLSSI